MVLPVLLLVAVVAGQETIDVSILRNRINQNLIRTNLLDRSPVKVERIDRSGLDLINREARIQSIFEKKSLSSSSFNQRITPFLDEARVAGSLELLHWSETDFHPDYSGLGGLGVQPLEENKALFYAVPSREAARPLFFKGDFMFEARNMEAVPKEKGIIPSIPRDNDQAFQPRGAHFCGEYLYIPTKDAVRRFVPGEEADAGVYAAPEGLRGALGGVSLSEQDKNNKVVFAVSEDPAAVPNSDKLAVSIFQWPANKGVSGEEVGPEAEYRLGMEAGERVEDLAWEGGRRLVFLISSPAGPRLYAAELPPSAGAAGVLGRELVAEFSVSGGNLTASGGNSKTTSVPFSAALQSVPALSALSFGPFIPNEESRSLFFLSDNSAGAEEEEPTRYFSARYVIPQGQVPAPKNH